MSFTDPRVREQDNSCVIYTPIYQKSPGTRYRLDLLLESFRRSNLHFRLVVDERESILKPLYEHFSANLLSKRLVWDSIGREIARRIAVYNPRVAIMLLDVTAGSAKYLQKLGVRTVVCVEDLTASYHDGIRANQERAKQVMEILCEELAYSDRIITPSHVLSGLLRERYGVQTLTVPIGVKAYVSEETAQSRERNYALHACQIHDNRQAEALTRISQELACHDITVLAHNAGKYAHFTKGVEWYRYSSPEEAVPHVLKAFAGIVTRFRPAFTLSSLYYHIGLLQPIVPVGEGSWIEEAKLLGASLVSDARETREEDVHTQAKAAARLSIPQVHRPLVDELKRLSRADLQ
jgi:hypothetical protein